MICMYVCIILLFSMYIYEYSNASIWLHYATKSENLTKIIGLLKGFDCFNLKLSNKIENLFSQSDFLHIICQIYF